MSERGAPLAESTWLAALVLVPLFVSPYSGRPFEPTKAALLQMLAGLLVATWLTGGSKADGQVPVGNPVALAAAAWVLVNLVSTATSVSPTVSVGGDYDRAQGLLTTLAYAAVFFAATRGLRTMIQFERVTSAVIVASVPVAVYAVGQGFGLDPLGSIRESALPSRRPVSTLGGPTFLGGYLVMTIPIALGRLLETTQTGSRTGLPACVYAVAVSLQLAALLLTRSRGALLGLLAGLATFAIVAWRRYEAGRAVIAAVAVVVAAFVAFATLYSLRQIELGGGTTRVRVLIWQGSLRLGLPHAPLWSPLDGPDPFNWLRPLVGYGPGSMAAAFSQVHPLELARLEVADAKPDRAHNETFDALVQTGFVGVLVYLALIAAVLRAGLRGLGLAATDRDRRAFLAWSLGVGLISAAGTALTLGPEYLGPALPAGMVLGFLGYVAIEVRRMDSRRARVTPEGGWIVVALLAALVGHVAETQVGISTTTTRAYFWFFSGALVAAASARLGGERTGAEDVAARVRTGGDAFAAHATGGDPVTVQAVLCGLALVAITFLFVTGGRSPGPAALAILAASFVVVLGAVLADPARTGDADDSGWGRASARFAAIALGLLLCFAVPYAAMMRRVSTGDPAVYLVALSFLVVFLLVGILVGARALTVDSSESPSARPWVPTRVLVGAGAGLLIAVLIGGLEGDVIERLAPQLAPKAAQRVALLEDARRLRPLVDHALVSVADGYLALARDTSHPGARDSALHRAERALRCARAMNPLEPSHTMNLARLESAAADLAARTEKERWSRRALRHYREAARLSPATASVYQEHATALLRYARLIADAGDVERAAVATEEAGRLRRRAREIDPRSARHEIDV